MNKLTLVFECGCFLKIWSGMEISSEFRGKRELVYKLDQLLAACKTHEKADVKLIDILPAKLVGIS